MGDIGDQLLSEKAQAARLAAVKKRSAAINTKGRAKDRRSSGEVRNRRDSIMSFCSECITAYGLDVGGNGSVAAAVRACPSVECHLYPWRNGKIDEEA